MPDVESTTAGQKPRSNASQSAITVVQEAEPPFIPAAAHAMTIVVEFPPGDPGHPPHRHSGPAFGYVLEGEMVFELEGEPARVVRAGEAFWEPGGDVIHYQDGNNRGDMSVRFTVIMLCEPGKPMLTFVDEEELVRRKNRRAPRTSRSRPQLHAPLRTQGSDMHIREQRRVIEMKIAVIGGTGLIGSQVVKILNASGHEAVPHSSSTGLDLLSGRGLPEALKGAHVVVNLTNSPTFHDASPTFFPQTMDTLLTAAHAAGVGHAVILSIVGAHHVPCLVYYPAN